MPRRYDLREQGVVTPVKEQKPFGTCWAFGGIAAAETSILSDAGTTYAQTPLDLSERHLAWFAVHPLTEDDDREQAGEGVHVVVGEGSSETEATFNYGGSNLYVTTLFSSGIGPILEEHFPYRGNTCMLESDYHVQHHDELLQVAMQSLADRRPDLDEEVRAEYAEERLAKILERLRKYNFYAGEDDWTIPDAKDGQSTRLQLSGYTLRDGNVLSEAALRGEATEEAPYGIWLGVNEDGTRAMKQELLNGHAVAVDYCADVSMPYQNETGIYLNLDTWAQYTFEDVEPNHAVCMGGWDDDYPAVNFTHKVAATDEHGDVIKDEDGHTVFNEERSGMTTPPGNVAWIVKNSWGSETDAVKDAIVSPVDGTVYDGCKRDWGYRNEQGVSTGYFYLSYYDKTLVMPETMDFDTDFATGPFYVEQYDFLPAMNGFWELRSYDNVASANVFAAEATSELASVSTRTFEENTRVTFFVYRLSENAANPEDGELLTSFSRNFEYAGFHRVNLSSALPFGKGERFSVVARASAVDGEGRRVFGVEAASALSQETSQAAGLTRGYGVAVVNPGESFLQIGPNWVDWADYQGTDEFKERAVTTHGDDELRTVVDNFSIKAYLVPNK